MCVGRMNGIGGTQWKIMEDWVGSDGVHIKNPIKKLVLYSLGKVQVFKVLRVT